MLFSSREFIFVFLPLAFLVFHFARIRFGGKAAMGLLCLASLVFYGSWNPPYLFLLVGSIAVNHVFARALTKMPKAGLIGIAICFNLALIGYYKYRNFFFENVELLTGANWEMDAIFIPLAISFFTFQQIAVLIDIYDGNTKVESWLDYALFVSFFPQLIAGPIVLYREIDRQFADLKAGSGPGTSLAGFGLVVFSVGLFKKVVLADSLAPFSDLAFGMVDRLTILEAWGAITAFSLQLYFDFSGYSDMAVGLGLMFGLRLPINFDTPFRSTSMIEFWRRWHITMTRFFMMYLYSPIALAAARLAADREAGRVLNFVIAAALPIAVTFLLSGLWHGAAWTFVAFGAINAAGLIVNHAWKEARQRQLPPLLGWLLTMLVVMISFVYFRAGSMAEAHHFLGLLIAVDQILLPNWLIGFAEQTGIPWRTLSFFATGSYTVKFAAWIVLGGGLSLLLPNVAKTAEDLRPSWHVATATAAMLLLAVGLLDRPQAFIYFQF